MYAFVDQLGIRFDNPKNGQAGWDMAAFSLNRRPGDVKIPVNGNIGEHERQFPGSWSVNDPATFASSGSSSMTRLRNRAHEEHFGIVPGVNEFSIFTGTEWTNAKNSNSPATINRIVPPPPSSGGPLAPQKPYPDPYTHTLRPPSAGALGGNVLTQADARFGMDDPNDGYHGDGYRHRVATGPHPIKSIGHGIYPGNRDQMRVADLDGDGEMEVIFGNLDGYVHILEFAGNGTSGSVGNPDDPYRLVDEWQSPRLGQGIFACDAQFVAGKAVVFFADARGQVWKISATGPNAYSLSNSTTPLVSPDPTYPLTYDGSTPTILVADFDGTGGGGTAEILVMNRFFDWSLFKASNGDPVAPQLSGRLERSTRTNGPTDAFVIERGDLDANKEVLLSSTNGGVWVLNRNAVGSTWVWADPEVVIPPSTCARNKVVPCYFNGGSIPSHLLSFCTDDDRDDTPPAPGAASGPDVIELFSVSFGSTISVVKLAEVDGSGESFAWIDRPKAGTSTASFAASGGGKRIGTYLINMAAIGGPAIAAANSIDLDTWYRENEFASSERVTSLECAALEGPGGSVAKQLIFSTARGRIHVIGTALSGAGLRDSSEEFPSGLPSTNYNPWGLWPSNRALSQIAACDLVQPEDSLGDPVPGQANFYFAEYTVPAFKQETSIGSGVYRPKFRIGRLGISTASGSGNEWEPYVASPTSGNDWEALRPNWTRSLSVDDFYDSANGAVQPDGELEFRVFTETGAAFVDSSTSSGPAIREFQTSSIAPRSAGGAAAWIAAIDAGYPTRPQFGGRVFEVRADRLGGRYWHLSGFTPKPDPQNYFFDTGGGASATPGWWYRRVGAIVDGQIASNNQSAHELSLGTSMRVARIRTSDSASVTTPHVVAGTTGGYVYAIEPQADPPSSNSSTSPIASTLRHQSTHLGTFIIGLDAGNLDGDEAGGDIDDEIVCGNWLDTGTFTDWDPQSPDLTKNRAHLYILDPNVQASGPSFMTTETLDGDDLAGAGNGISSGVTGVKIDDIDGDGDSEIWCSDATGHLYLFAKDDIKIWHCVFRSDDLCAYPGFYNNLHPIKGVGGATVKLAVQSPGYFFVFDVDADAITATWWGEQ